MSNSKRVQKIRSFYKELKSNGKSLNWLLYAFFQLDEKNKKIFKELKKEVRKEQEFFFLSNKEVFQSFLLVDSLGEQVDGKYDNIEHNINLKSKEELKQLLTMFYYLQRKQKYLKEKIKEQQKKLK